MKDSNPPEVEVDESDGTYLLVVGKPGEMSPEYLEKTRNKIWRKIVDKTVDPAMMERLFGEITAEVIDDDFKKTKRKEISE
jgi:hypothetical protein